MIKIDFSFIANPVISEDRNTVTGHIGGQEVVVSRVHHGWNVNLRISIDGLCLHEDTPSEKDKDEFTALYERAFTIRDKAHEAKRTAVANSNAFKKVFRKL